MSATALETIGARRRRDVWPAGAVCALTALAQAILWLAAYRQWITIAWAIALHGVIAAALVSIVIQGHRRDGFWSPLLILLALATVTLGPVGALGVVLSCVVRNVTDRNAVSFDEWYRQLFPEEDEVDELRAVEKMAENVIAGDGRVSIGPLLDVLSHGTRPQKQVAIGVFTRQFHPAFAPALRMALRDADSAIRVQAATSMTLIENNFLERATELERASAEMPASPERIKAVAKHHDDYAHTGVLDPLRERRSRVVALRNYLKYLRLNPNDSECRLAAARLFYHRGRHAAAARWIERCIRDGIFTINMAPWYMDCLYKLRRFAELRAFATKHSAELSRLDLFPIRVMETVKLWSSDDVTETRGAT